MFHGQSHWRAPRLKAGAEGCHPARLPAHSPIDALPSGCPAKATFGVATWGRGPRGGPDWHMPRSDRRTLARPVGRGRHTGLLCNANPALARGPRCMAPALTRGPRCMAEVPATERGRGGRLVAAACKLRHMGTVACRRGTDVPRGTAAYLDKRRPVPRPATVKVASGIAVTAKGSWRPGPSGRAASGQLVSDLMDRRILMRPAEAGWEPRFPCRVFSVRESSPAPSPPPSPLRKCLEREEGEWGRLSPISPPLSDRG